MTGARDLARLYEQHAPAALRLAYVLTGDHALAEDLVQDAFVRIIGRLGQLRSEVAFDAYLRRTVVNLSYGTFRRRRVERAWLARERGTVRRDGEEPDGVEERDELWHRLASVAPRQRAALVLRYYEDLSEEQAAQVLGCSTRALRSLTSRGLQALRTQESVVAR
jgi:RNA polymerase sigma-70 factor (sigma-E family)